MTMARQSFVRSGGERGASVETLRGSGADFEGKAIVKRGDGDGVSCGCFGSSVRNENAQMCKHFKAGLTLDTCYLITGYRRSFSVDQRALPLCV